MGLMKYAGIRVMFYTPKYDPLAWFTRAVTGSMFTHVDIELDGVGYGISLMGGSKLYPRGIAEVPREYIDIPVSDQYCLEFPFLVLDQRIHFWESVWHHVKRWWSEEYRMVTPVTNCVTMVNILLNHNLNTNWFNGYTPDDLYEQTKRYIAHRKQRPSGVLEDQDSINQVHIREV